MSDLLEINVSEASINQSFTAESDGFQIKYQGPTEQANSDTVKASIQGNCVSHRKTHDCDSEGGHVMKQDETYAGRIRADDSDIVMTRIDYNHKLPGLPTSRSASGPSTPPRFLSASCLHQSSKVDYSSSGPNMVQIKTCADNEFINKTNSQTDSSLASTHMLLPTASNVSVKKPTYLKETNRWSQKKDIRLKQMFKSYHTMASSRAKCNKSPRLSRFRWVNTRTPVAEPMTIPICSAQICDVDSNRNATSSMCVAQTAQQQLHMPASSNHTLKAIKASSTLKSINPCATFKSKFRFTSGSCVRASSKSTSEPLVPAAMLKSTFKLDAASHMPSLSKPPLAHAKPIVQAPTYKSKYKLSRSHSNTEFQGISHKMNNEPNSGSRWLLHQRSKHKLLVKQQVQSSYIEHRYRKPQERPTRCMPQQQRHAAVSMTVVPHSFKLATSWKSYSSFKLVRRAIKHSNNYSKRKLGAMTHCQSHENVPVRHTHHRLNMKIQSQRRKSNAWTRKYSLKHAYSMYSGENVSPFVLRRVNIGQVLPRGLLSNRSHQVQLPMTSEARTKVDTRKTVTSRVIQKSIHTAHRAHYKKSLIQTLPLTYCLYYNRFGRCHRGNKCQHIHDPARVVMCTRFLRGRCRVTNCSFLHKVHKEMMPVCQFFLRGICCRDNCPYLHNKVNKDAGICDDFAQGLCHLADKCKKKHSFSGKRRTRVPGEKSEDNSSPNKMRPSVQNEGDIVVPVKGSTSQAFITIGALGDGEQQPDAQNISGVFHIRPRLSKI